MIVAEFKTTLIHFLSMELANLNPMMVYELGLDIRSMYHM